MGQQIIRTEQSIEIGQLSKVGIVDQIFIAKAVRDLDVDWLMSKAGSIPALKFFEGMAPDKVLATCHTARLKMMDATEMQKMDSEIFLRLKGYKVA